MKKSNDNERIDESSEESFPASDPPSWAASPPPPGRHAGGETSHESTPGRPFEGLTRPGSLFQLVAQQAARLPSDLFLWTGVAAAATSLGLLGAGKKHASLFVATWVPTILLLGVYSKTMATAGSAPYRQDLH